MVTFLKADIEQLFFSRDCFFLFSFFFSSMFLGDKILSFFFCCVLVIVKSLYWSTLFGGVCSFFSVWNKCRIFCWSQKFSFDWCSDSEYFDIFMDHVRVHIWCHLFGCSVCCWLHECYSSSIYSHHGSNCSRRVFSVSFNMSFDNHHAWWSCLWASDLLRKLSHRPSVVMLFFIFKKRSASLSLRPVVMLQFAGKRSTTAHSLHFNFATVRQNVLLARFTFDFFWYFWNPIFWHFLIFFLKKK